jgi:hypothetical protein
MNNRKDRIMFLNRKANGPALFMKFGVDDQGFVVPFLRRSRNQSVQANSGSEHSALKAHPHRPKVATQFRG